MEPWLREAVNYFVYYLSQGILTADQVEQQFARTHGELTPTQFDQVLAAANQAIANALNFNNYTDRKIIRNAIAGLMPGQTTVEIRALCTAYYANGRVETALEVASFSVNDTVGDVRAWFSQRCPVNDSIEGAQSYEYQIIPGILLPSLAEP